MGGRGNSLFWGLLSSGRQHTCLLPERSAKSHSLVSLFGVSLRPEPCTNNGMKAVKFVDPSDHFGLLWPHLLTYLDHQT